MSRSEKVWTWLARCLPRRLVYWTLIRAGVEHIGGPGRPHEVVPEVPFTEVLSRVYPR